MQQVRPHSPWDESIEYDLVASQESTNGLLTSSDNNDLKNLCGLCSHRRLCPVPFLVILDHIWSFFIVTPLCMIYWGGTWKIIDNYILPYNNMPSAYISFATGCVICVIAYFVYPILKDHIEVRCHIKHILVSRILLYIHGYGIVNFWRGVWLLMDNFLGPDLQSVLISLCVCFMTLVILKATSHSVGTPFKSLNDNRTDFYTTYPVFRSKSEDECFYILDALFSHFIVHFLVIEVWRCVWFIMDSYIYPEDMVKSYLTCLVSGYVFAVILAGLQYPMSRFSVFMKQNHHLLELLVVDFFNIALIFTSILIWRGGLGLMKNIVLKNMVHIWSAHAVTAFTLLCFQLGSNLARAGIDKDCELGNGKAILFKNRYFSYIFSNSPPHQSEQIDERSVEESITPSINPSINPSECISSNPE